MRLLHTADWHLGRRFGHWDLLADQAAFVDWLVELVREEEIDAVLVAGDLFDRAVPPHQAVELADDALARLLEQRVQVVAISGNHDSAQRLAFGARAMAAAGLHIRTERRSCDAVGGPVTLQPRRDGDSPVTVLPVPYLDPLRMDEIEGVARTHDGVVARVVAQALAACGCAPETCIVMGHAFVNGGEASESERALTVGGSSLVELASFGGAGYVALGHLHRPQSFAGDTVWYSGSPLAYSFGEEHEKQVRIVEATGSITSRAVPVGVGRLVRTLTGTLDEILSSPAHAAAESAFVRVRLTDTEHKLGAMEAVQRRFPWAAELTYVDLARQADAAVHDLAGPGRRDVREVIRLYTAQTLGEAPGDWVTSLLDEAYARA